MGDLIEVAELDAGRRQFTMERLRPLQLLNDARDRFFEDAAQKRIRVEVKAYEDLSFVQADRRAVRSILDNLLSNAIRYTPIEGEILLAAEEIQYSLQSRCAIPDAASRPTGWEPSSTASALSPSAAPASDSPWSAAWSSSWAVRLPSRAAWDTELPSALLFL